MHVERNRLLAALGPAEYARLEPHLHRVTLAHHERIASPGQPIETVYFPQDAVISMIVIMDDGKSIESAAIGNEGFVGLEQFLGDGVAHDKIVVQIAGSASALTAGEFRGSVRGSLPLQLLLQRYSLALMNQISRTAGCNQVHTVNERCARWLLMCRDRVGRDDFALTHEFLGTMLGVRRASVSEAAESMRGSGLISYRQGRVRILNVAGLKALACEDYVLSKAGYDHMDGRLAD